jgi:hypothetical protein
MHTYLNNTTLSLHLAHQRRDDLESAARRHRLARLGGRRRGRDPGRDAGTTAPVIRLPQARVTSDQAVPRVA